MRELERTHRNTTTTFSFRCHFSFSRNSLLEQCILLKKINAKHNCRTQPSTCISKLVLDWHRDVCLSTARKFDFFTALLTPRHLIDHPCWDLLYSEREGEEATLLQHFLAVPVTSAFAFYSRAHDNLAKSEAAALAS